MKICMIKAAYIILTHNWKACWDGNYAAWQNGEKIFVQDSLSWPQFNNYEFSVFAPLWLRIKDKHKRNRTTIEAMHFPIIVLEEYETQPEDWLQELPVDDGCLLYNTDYYGEKYDDDMRWGVIKSNWLKDVFEGIAIVDPVTECLYFQSEQTIRDTLKKYYTDGVDRLSNLIKTGAPMYYDVTSFGKRYKDDFTLYFSHKEGYAQTSLSFIDDAPYYAEKTLRIGNIFDAHI